MVWPSLIRNVFFQLNFVKRGHAQWPESGLSFPFHWSSHITHQNAHFLHNSLSVHFHSGFNRRRLLRLLLSSLKFPVYFCYQLFLPFKRKFVIGKSAINWSTLMRENMGLSLTGTVNAAHSQGWVQLVVLPSLHWEVRTRFCGKASTSYLLKLPLVFTKEKKKSKKLFSAKPQESCWSASPPGPGTRPVTDPAQHPPEGLGWDHKTSAAHLQKCMAAPQANTGWVGGTKKIRMQSPLCHLLYFKHCLLIKGPSQTWMSSLAGRTDVAYPITTKSWNTPRELHSHQPAPGWGNCRGSSFLISLSHHATNSKEKSKCIMQSLGTFHITQWLLTAQKTGHCMMTFMLLAWQ